MLAKITPTAGAPKPSKRLGQCGPQGQHCDAGTRKGATPGLRLFFGTSQNPGVALVDSFAEPFWAAWLLWRQLMTFSGWLQGEAAVGVAAVGSGVGAGVCGGSERAGARLPQRQARPRSQPRPGTRAPEHRSTGAPEHRSTGAPQPAPPSPATAQGRSRMPKQATASPKRRSEASSTIAPGICEEPFLCPSPAKTVDSGAVVCSREEL
jgi:hypothetical protein